MKGRPRVYSVLMKNENEIKIIDNIKVQCLLDILKVINENKKFNEFYFIRKRTNKLEFYITNEKIIKNNKEVRLNELNIFTPIKELMEVIEN